jgi:hypothetical protein
MESKDGVLTQEPAEEEEMTIEGKNDIRVFRSSTNGLSQAQKRFSNKDLRNRVIHVYQLGMQILSFCLFNCCLVLTQSSHVSTLIFVI